MIAPFQEDRENARRIIGADRFFEVYVSTSLGVSRGAGPQGPLLKGRRGEIAEFTGISSPYERPKTRP